MPGLVRANLTNLAFVPGGKSNDHLATGFSLTQT